MIRVSKDEGVTRPGEKAGIWRYSYARSLVAMFSRLFPFVETRVEKQKVRLMVSELTRQEVMRRGDTFLRKSAQRMANRKKYAITSFKTMVNLN